MATIAEALALAADHHQAGRLAEAETLYRRILEADPENAPALHLLGVLAAQLGHFAAAAELIGEAIRHNPSVPDYHRHRAMALDRLGRTEEAADACAAAAGLAPGHADTLFNLGVLLDRLGRRGEAADAFAGALDADPGHAGAANNRGLVLRSLGREEEAAESFGRAGRIDPGFAAAWYHQALALTALGREEEARTALRRAVSADPALAGAQVNLANALQTAGRAEAAARHYDHALRLDPGLAAAWRGLASLRHGQGRFTEAAAAYGEAIRRGTPDPFLWNALGTCRMAAGDGAGAAAAFTAWAAVDPGDAEAHYALAVAAARAGDDDGAERAYRRTVRLVPGDSRPPGNLALLLAGAGRHGEAIAPLRLVVTLNPTLAEPWYNLGVSLRLEERGAEAVEAYRRALILRPDDLAAAYNRAVDLQELGRIEEAAAGYRRVLALAPCHGEAHCNLASVLRAAARYAESTAGYRHALDLEPGSVAAHRNLLSAILYDPAWTEARRFAEHRRFEERHARPLYALARPPEVVPDPERRLRIGYLSSDFREHPVGRNLEPLLASHDHGRVFVACYADVPRPDAATVRFQGHADLWRPIAGLSDAEVAERIRADRIDVLVLLAGRFDNNRPLVAAYRPAPLQVSLYDGATSGLEAMDAILTDRVMTPRHGAELFTERPVRLPTLYAYSPIPEAPEVTPPPLLDHGTVTFGSFNNPAKLSDEALALWARVLRAVPGSRLALKYKNLYAAPGLQARIRGVLSAGGVDPARVVTPAAVQERQHHLALYRGVDVALDPFPFCGATTTFEALYMGVPVVTLPGANMMSRWSASLLAAVGLPDLIAGTPDDYVRIAAGLAGDPRRLSELRAALRPRIHAAPFLDGRSRARNMERVCRALWRRWCAGRPAQR
ncbi:tetratricopeptide repeat protein [Azospirillum thermophilum]|uniref:protein O-GlcNAc transferase n=1 Tax=Azospirillum thermophilum TaxID=2202148 RepID=A0A2S2CWH3_9PROT|nr:tetratricopeptide repeat protein [Azospirillum thermophilum]AWK88808.1 hypothetical protein DEW08_22295 [Azospirillum thermophilum]